MTTKKKFDPNDHLIDIKGKPYLPVAWRIVWFREEHPDWSIETKISDDKEQQRATAKTIVSNAEGKVVATGHKTATPRGMIKDYVELAETGAVGRALAYCGYGTQFAPELDEGDNIADAPIDTKTTKKPSQGNTGSSKGKLYVTTAEGKALLKAYYLRCKKADVDAQEFASKVLDEPVDLAKVEKEDLIKVTKMVSDENVVDNYKEYAHRIGDEEVDIDQIIEEINGDL